MALAGIGRGVKATLVSAFVLTFFAFSVIAMWGSIKSSCVGQLVGGALTAVIGKEQEPQLSVRPIDLERDAHILRTLVAVGRAAGMTQDDLGQVRIAIIESDEWNAISLGGKRFMFTSGLRHLPTRHLSAIIAHELAHETLGHSRAMHDRANTIGTAVDIIGRVLGHDSAGREEVSKVVGDFVLPSYSREQELEADTRAVQILRGLPLSEPTARKRVVDALERLKERYGSTGGGFFSTHPATTERIDRLR